MDLPTAVEQRLLYAHPALTIETRAGRGRSLVAGNAAVAAGDLLLLEEPVAVHTAAPGAYER